MPVFVGAASAAKVLQQPSRLKPLPHALHGFTLVELLVVFAIMALVTAVAPMAYEKMQDSLRYRETVRGMVTLLRAARQQAVLTGHDTLFELDLRERRYGQPGDRMQTIPAGLAVHATVADTEADDQRLDIRFLPSGAASGGSIDIVRPSGAGVRLRVDWFSGRVEQRPLIP